MGEAFITRRGGGFDITKITDMNFLSFSDGGSSDLADEKYRVGADVIEKAKAYIVASGGSGAAFIGIYSPEGEELYDSSSTDTGQYTKFIIDGDYIHISNVGSGAIALTVIY